MDRNLNINYNDEYLLNLKEKRDFFNAFFVYYKSGIPIVDSIKKISEKNTSSKIRKIAKSMYRDFVLGKSFEEVIHRQEKVFGKVNAGLLISGEQSGKLVIVLSRIQTLLQQENHIKNKVIQAMTYPAIILMLMIFVSCLFAFFVFPMMTFNDRPNIFVQAITAIIKTIVVYGIFIGGYIVIKKNHIVEKKIIPVLMKLPKIGEIVYNAALANFFLVLSVAYDGGLSATTMLDLASETIKQKDLKHKMKKAVKHIVEGDDITTALTKEEALNENFIAAIATGETTGELDKALNNIIEEIDDRTDIAINALNKALEVVMMIIAAFCVLILLAVVYSKMTNMYRNF